MARTGHVKKMARGGEAESRTATYKSAMHSRYANGVSIRTLRNGDTETIGTVFGRLGDESRRLRFGGPKPHLSEVELASLARVDSAHHVLVAYVDGDREPAGIARLVRLGRTAEVAFAVADEHQGRKVGSTLAKALAADARAAGIVELHATVAGGNRRALSLLSRIGRRMGATWQGGQCELVAALD
jgi:GNAT superfamily N-acetyltransferase